MQHTVETYDLEYFYIKSCDDEHDMLASNLITCYDTKDHVCYGMQSFRTIMKQLLVEKELKPFEKKRFPSR